MTLAAGFLALYTATQPPQFVQSPSMLCVFGRHATHRAWRVAICEDRETKAITGAWTRRNGTIVCPVVGTAIDGCMDALICGQRWTGEGACR